MAHEKLINYTRLTELVNLFEKLLKDEGIDIDEEKLLMDVLRDRREQKLNKLKMSDAMGSLPLGGLLGRVTKSLTRDKDDEEI